MVQQLTNSLLDSSPALQPNQLKYQLESVLHFITARWYLLGKNNYYYVFLLLGVTVAPVRSGMPSLADSLQTIKGSSEAWCAEWCSHSFIFHFWMLLLPPERSDMSHIEVWGYSGFISSFGWRAEVTPWPVLMLEGIEQQSCSFLLWGKGWEMGEGGKGQVAARQEGDAPLGCSRSAVCWKPLWNCSNQALQPPLQRGFSTSTSLWVGSSFL